MQELTFAEAQEVSGGLVEAAFVFGLVVGVALGAAAGYTIAGMM